MQIKGCIFDLDGVIVDTTKYHFLAWKSICDELGINFSKEDNEQLKGVSRVRSLEILLEMGEVELSSEEKVRFLTIKNERYLVQVDAMKEDEILPGVLKFISELQSKNIKIALGSASKNAKRVISALGIRDLFETIIDGNDVERSKPNPEVFLKAAGALGLANEDCVVFEDSVAGIDAANSGNFISVGVGDSEVLTKADLVIKGFYNFTYTQLVQNLPIRS